jgi:hypothetical protein
MCFIRISLLQTSELCMQPLLHFAMSLPTVLYNFITSAHTIYKLPEDGADAPKHVGAFIIYFCTMCVCVCVHLLVESINIDK